MCCVWTIHPAYSIIIGNVYEIFNIPQAQQYRRAFDIKLIGTRQFSFKRIKSRFCTYSLKTLVIKYSVILLTCNE